MSYGFLPEAEVEYLQAIKFYEDQIPGPCKSPLSPIIVDVPGIG